jgi:hypothetical protein
VKYFAKQYFRGNGQDWEPGQEIPDAAQWQTLDVLIEHRYIEAKPDSEVQDAGTPKTAGTDGADQKVEAMLDEMKTGGGWYHLGPDGPKVKGRPNARAKLLELLAEPKKIDAEGAASRTPADTSEGDAGAAADDVPADEDANAAADAPTTTEPEGAAGGAPNGPAGTDEENSGGDAPADPA